MTDAAYLALIGVFAAMIGLVALCGGFIKDGRTDRTILARPTSRGRGEQGSTGSGLSR